MHNSNVKILRVKNQTFDERLLRLLSCHMIHGRKLHNFKSRASRWSCSASGEYGNSEQSWRYQLNCWLIVVSTQWSCLSNLTRRVASDIIFSHNLLQYRILRWTFLTTCGTESPQHRNGKRFQSRGSGQSKIFFASDTIIFSHKMLYLLIWNVSPHFF